MIVMLWWKDDPQPTFLKSVESVREVREGIEVKCFGNEPYIHHHSRLSTFSVVKEPFVQDIVILGDPNKR